VREKELPARIHTLSERERERERERKSERDRGTGRQRYEKTTGERKGGRERGEQISKVHAHALCLSVLPSLSLPSSPPLRTQAR